MILRRVIEHVRKQEWTAIAIDFLIVVAGVFVGLQVQQWSESRAEARSESDILGSITEDVRLDRRELATGRQIAMTAIRAANYALARAGAEPVTEIVMAADVPQLDSRALVVDQTAQDAVPTPEEKARLWSLVVVGYYPTGSSTAFETLVSTGKLGIIKDSDLIRELQNYRQLWHGLNASHLSTYRPFRNQAVFVGQGVGLSTFTQMGENEFIALLSDNPALQAAFRTHLEYTVLHLSQIEEVDRNAVLLLQRLDPGGLER